jgi:hypothetical protein
LDPKDRFLKNGLDVATYKRCDAAIDACPQEQSLRLNQCVKKVIKTSDCKQLKPLVEKIKGALGFVDAEEVDHLALITQRYLADGQSHYYIISPTGCMVDMSTDPRTIDKNLEKRFKKMDLMVTMSEKPTIQSNPNGAQRVSAPITLTKGCKACEVVGKATLQFDFSPKGKLVKTEVVNFVEGN